jgi:hypothetical protein
MGHCEMQLAVAGLDKNAIAGLTRSLAEGDWSRFPPGERAALSFARKLATPATAAEDFSKLVNHLGRSRAVDVAWWVCHCHYMTRVADAFQLPLEKDNVFDAFAP